MVRRNKRAQKIRRVQQTWFKCLYVGRYSLLMRGYPFFMLLFIADLKRPCE